MKVEALCLGGPLDGRMRPEHGGFFWHPYIVRAQLPSVIDFDPKKIPDTVPSPVRHCRYQMATRRNEDRSIDRFWIADES